MPPLAASLAAFAFGAIVGSFLNVCIYRLPEKRSVAFPGSHCRTCSKPIAWYDNVPCVSWFALGGKCRHCKSAISMQYVAVEFLTGALFVLFLAVFGPTPKGAAYLALTLALLVQTFIDIRHRIIPDGLTLPGIALAFAVSVVFPELHGTTDRLQAALASGLGILVGGGSLYLAGTLAEWLLKKEAMGGGDVKLLAMIGGVLGWKAVLWTIFVSSFVGSFAGIYAKLRKGEELIPYGPFLAAGAVSYIFFGVPVTQWYLRAFMGV